MDYIPKIDVENIKEFHDQYTLIDLLKSGYKQAISENDNTKKILRRADNFSDIQFARWSALNNSFNQTIVLLEQLEVKFNKQDIEHIQAEEGAF